MMKQRPMSLLWLLLSAALSVCAGCSAQRVAQSLDDSHQLVAKGSADLKAAVDQAPNRPNFAIKSGRPWVQTKPIRTSEARVADEHPDLKCNDLVFVTPAPVGVLEFAQRASTLCGIPIKVTSDALQQVNGFRSANATSGASSLPAIPALPDLPVPNAQPTAGAASGQQAASSFADGYARTISVKYKGPLAGLLDTVTANLGLSWKVTSDKKVEIFYVDTRVFTIMALQSSTETSSVVQASATSSVGGDGSSVAGSSGSNQSTTTTIKNDLLGDVEKTVRTMLTPGVGRMNLSPSTGSITVTDTPDVLRGIKSYVERENANITKQVAFQVQLYTVTFRDEKSDSLDMTLVYKRLESQGLSLTNKSGLGDENAVQGGITISGDSKWAGSSVLASTLAEQGTVNVVTSSTIYTTNLQPAPFQVTRQTAYLQSSQMNNSSGSDTPTTSLQPGTITTGFSMTLLPFILPDADGDILLQYAVNLSNLIGLKTVESGGSSIQTPEVDSRIFSQRIKVREGETLIVGGFEQETDDATARGTGSAFNPLLGGGFSSKKSKSVIVVAITPKID